MECFVGSAQAVPFLGLVWREAQLQGNTGDGAANQTERAKETARKKDRWLVEWRIRTRFHIVELISPEIRAEQEEALMEDFLKGSRQLIDQELLSGQTFHPLEV